MRREVCETLGNRPYAQCRRLTGPSLSVIRRLDVAGMAFLGIVLFLTLRPEASGAGPTLAEALDATNVTFWSTGGDSAWSGQTLFTHDGVDAAESGLIFAQPEGKTVLVGDSVSFSATAFGAMPLSFQWSKA